MQGIAHRRNRVAAAAVTAGVIASAVFTGTATASASSNSEKGGHRSGPAHIFYIMMENHGYSQIIGNTQDAPYVNQLAAKYPAARAARSASAARYSAAATPR
jgi:hypothetical protein